MTRLSYRLYSLCSQCVQISLNETNQPFSVKLRDSYSVNPKGTQSLIIPKNSVTVAEILSLEELSLCKVVAGSKGLSRPVRWVHTSDLPDASFWLRGGEILIHSGARKGINLVHLIRQLHSAGAVAVAIAEASDVLTIEAERIANEMELPLILIPDEVKFVDLTYAIAHALIDHELSLSLEIGEFWNDVMQTTIYELDSTLQYVSEWLDCSVTLFDKFRTQIMFNIPQKSQQKRKAPFVSEMNFSEALLSPHGVYGSIGPNQLWVSVVRYRSSILSFVVFDFGTQTNEVSLRKVIPAIQLIRLAVTMSSQTLDLRLQLSGDVFRSILEEEISNKVLEGRCKEVGIDFTMSGRIIVFKAVKEAISISFQQVEYLTTNFAREEIIVRPLHDTLIVWTPNVTNENRDRHLLLVDRIRQIIAKITKVEEWLVGIGGELSGIEGIRRSHKQAEIALKRCLPSATAYFEDLSVWDVLMNQLDSAMSQEILDQYILPIGAKERVRLKETINALIDAEFNVTKAAELLSLHRNGLNRRLDRWRERLGIDFTRPQNVLSFSVILSQRAQGTPDL